MFGASGGALNNRFRIAPEKMTPDSQKAEKKEETNDGENAF